MSKIVIRRAPVNGEECELMTQELRKYIEPFIGHLKGPGEGDASGARSSKMPADSIYLVAEDQSNEPPSLMGAVGMRPLEAGTAMFNGLPRDHQRVGEIKRTVVVEEARRKGVGRKLMIGVAEHAKADGYQYLVLETLHQMPQAQRFYEHCGWKRRAVFGGYSDDDSVFYEKWLI